MFQICILVTIDVMHPYIVGYDDGRRFSTRLFYKAIAELYILLSHFLFLSISITSILYPLFVDFVIFQENPDTRTTFLLRTTHYIFGIFGLLNHLCQHFPYGKT